MRRLVHVPGGLFIAWHTAQTDINNLILKYYQLPGFILAKAFRSSSGPA